MARATGRAALVGCPGCARAGPCIFRQSVPYSETAHANAPGRSAWAIVCLPGGHVKARHMLGSGHSPARERGMGRQPPPPISGIWSAPRCRCLEIAAVGADAVIPQEEAALVVRAREGDQEAFGVLVRLAPAPGRTAWR